MSRHDAFAPIVNSESKVLILGSMPGIASLQAQAYYAHPRNAFWTIMGALFGAGPELDYAYRQTLLLANQLAVWDVLASCYRQGSLDSQIVRETMQVNDFATFFRQYPNITTIYFNGKTAESVYRQQVFARLDNTFGYLHYHCLPSTSPAYAAMPISQKLAAWQFIKAQLDISSVLK